MKTQGIFFFFLKNDSEGKPNDSHGDSFPGRRTQVRELATNSQVEFRIVMEQELLCTFLLSESVWSSFVHNFSPWPEKKDSHLKFTESGYNGADFISQKEVGCCYQKKDQGC